MPYANASLTREFPLPIVPDNLFRGALIGMPFCLVFWAVLLLAL